MKNGKKILKITQTAGMLALLIALQALTKPLGQLVTGSCVNAVLAVTALTVGAAGGTAVAVLSPVFAFLLGIAPQPLTVPVIMLGNACYVAFLVWLNGTSWVRRIGAWLASSVAKAALLYVLVAKVLCGIAAPGLLEQGLLKQPMLQALPATFSWPQLVTALIGGGVAMCIVPVIKKAIKTR